MNADGSGVRRVTDGAVGSPSWSADGAWIYFTSNRSGRTAVWKVKPDGGEPEQVTKDGIPVARESLDGKWLFLMRYPSSSSPGSLFRRPIAGGAETKVADVFSFTLTSSHVYYVKHLDDGRDSIFRQPVAGGAATMVWSRNPKPVLGYMIIYGLTISPDEKTLLFSEQDTFGSDILLVENFR